MTTILLIGIVITTLPGCFVVYYSGMPVVYDSIRLPSDQMVENIPYADFGQEDRKGRLDLFLPSEGDDWPVLIFVHGGGWDEGDKDLKFGGKQIYLNIGRYFASQGIATAVINYRLLPGVHWKTQVGDVADATNWVLENIGSYGGNANAVFLSGHSAGAQLAARAAIEPGLVSGSNDIDRPIKGVIAVSGAGYEMEDEETNRSGKMMSYLEKRYSVVDKSGTWPAKASILDYVSSDDPPFQIFVGGSEGKELIRQSHLLKEVLDENGVTNTIEIVPGRRHARMILLLSGNGNNVGEKITAFVKTKALSQR